MFKHIILTIITMMSAIANAENPHIYGSLQIGTGGLAVSKEYSFDEDDDYSSGLDFGAGIGLRVDRVVMEFNHISGNGLSFLGAADSYNLEQNQVLVGYSIPLPARIRLTPAIGLSSWRITGREGAFLNPGIEASFEDEGSDLVFAFEFEKSITRYFAIAASASIINSDFGAASSTRFIAKLQY